MTKGMENALPPAAQRLLGALAASEPGASAKPSPDVDILACLIRADLVVARPDNQLEITTAGWSHLARLKVARGAIDVDPFLGQHLDLVRRSVATPHGRAEVTIDEAESPLAWLARRKGRDGRPLIAAEQLQAGEKLRAQFTAANLTPRTTSNWNAPIAQSAGGRGGGAAAVADVIVAARQQVRRALDAAGPEFGGLLIDVCCFLKGSKMSSASAAGRRVRRKSSCSSASTVLPAITASRRKRAAGRTRRFALGFLPTRPSWSMEVKNGPGGLRPPPQAPHSRPTGCVRPSSGSHSSAAASNARAGRAARTARLRRYRESRAPSCRNST